ncbi:hypothetical protein VW098_08135 [Phaeobacter sp. JH57H2]|uniref:hypothetical protein n=1 Tax=unclassified Phaeobacter TaxID=2621772 RepID=UPI003A89B5DC
MAKVLIGCETSGIVREAFLAIGHDAWSCDLLPSDTPTNRHIQGDIRDVMQDSWDLMAVMHPPCTRLCNSGVRWLSEPPKNPPADCTEEEAAIWPTLSRADKLAMIWRHLDAGAALFSDCWNADIPLVAIENPVMHPHAKERIRNYEPLSQSVQPWQFGTDEDGPDNEKKRICFWLRGLPDLTHTGTLDGSTARSSVSNASPGKDRWKERSRFFPGIAAAMADQWGAAAQARYEAAAA